MKNTIASLIIKFKVTKFLSIIQRIKEKIKFNPYVSYEQLIQLDTSTSINSVLEYLIDTKQLGVVKLDKENKYGEHKWRWK